MGPGTHVVRRVLTNTKPVDYVDAIALKHDIDYMVAAGDEQALTKADNAAIALAPNLSVTGQIMRNGLILRQLLGIKPSYDNRFNHSQTRQIGMRLQQIALDRGLFSEYPLVQTAAQSSVNGYKRRLSSQVAL